MYRMEPSMTYKQIRQAANLSINQMAEYLGVDSRTVRRYEDGTRKPGGPVIKLYEQIERTHFMSRLRGHMDLDKLEEIAKAAMDVETVWQYVYDRDPPTDHPVWDAIQNLRNGHLKNSELADCPVFTVEPVCCVHGDCRNPITKRNPIHQGFCDEHYQDAVYTNEDQARDKSALSPKAAPNLEEIKREIEPQEATFAYRAVKTILHHGVTDETQKKNGLKYLDELYCRMNIWANDRRNLLTQPAQPEPALLTQAQMEEIREALCGVRGLLRGDGFHPESYVMTRIDEALAILSKGA